MTKKAFFDLLERYESGQASEQEIDLFNRFFEAFQNDSTRWQDWELSAKERTKLEILAKIQSRIAPKPEKGKIRRLRIWGLSASVASILLLISIFYFRQGGPYAETLLTQSTHRGETAEVLLSDGSIITLNAESSITYPETFGDEVRKVELKGEAYFQVKHQESAPFIVSAGGVETQVLGTSFNIDSYQTEATTITLVEGKVSVEAEGQKETLSPGQLAYYNQLKGTLTKKEVDVAAYTAWLDNVILFDETPLDAVISSLERNFDKEFTVKEATLLDCKISGKFKEKHIENVLEGLQFLTGIAYEIQADGSIELSGNGCN